MKRNATNKKSQKKTKKFEVPGVVTIGGHNIAVFMDPQTDTALADAGAIGMYTPAHQGIAIRSDVSKSVQAETYFHEIVEAINDLFELELPHNKIQTLGAALHQARISEEGKAG